MGAKSKKTVTITTIVSLALSLCGCCSENCNEAKDSLELSKIYQAALGGALIGGIIGYQSDETGEGVAVGATLFSVGELLRQTDELARKEKEHREHEDECDEQVIIEIHNSNGSITPVKIKRENYHFIGPKGERYDQMPTEEQLKPIYGL
jgi:hypothetical protein